MRIRLFTDSVTIYHKTIDDNEIETWTRTVIKGVQWSDNSQKSDASGRISVARYATITFPEGTYNGLVLEPGNEEDAIIYGEITDEVTGSRGARISDLMNKYPRSGRLKQVNDNSNRTFLKNIKVTIG